MRERMSAGENHCERHCGRESVGERISAGEIKRERESAWERINVGENQCGSKLMNKRISVGGTSVRENQRGKESV